MSTRSLVDLFAYGPDNSVRMTFYGVDIVIIPVNPA